MTELTKRSDLSVHSNSVSVTQNLRSILSSRSSNDCTVAQDLLVQYDTVMKSFCPNILLAALADSKRLSSRSERFSGACMLADISGFSKLSRLLGDVGSSGLDDLRRCTTRFLSKYIYIVYAFGGDVVSFAGDALICIFPTKAGQSPYQCKRNAIESGLILKELSTDRLEAHIAVTFGDMYFSLLGGFSNEWVYALSGPCVQQLSDCIEEARPTELVVTAECFDLPDDYLDQLCYERTSLGNVRIQSINDSSTDQLDSTQCCAARFAMNFTYDPDFTLDILSFVPVPVVSSLTAGSFKTIAELREVTTVFVKLDSYDPVVHTDLSALQPFVLLAQEVLSLAGGALRQFVVDDKGCVVIALWGVPSASYTNNAHRAVVFSGTLVAAARRIGHSCSIGITSGKAFCGTIGSILRRDYVAMGDCVNMAARLMSKAKGRILVDKASLLSLPSNARGSLQPAESMLLKGRAEPVQPYCLQASLNGGEAESDVVSMERLFIDMTLASEVRVTTIMCPVQIQGLKDAHGDAHRPEDMPSLGHGTNLDPHVTDRLDQLVTQLKRFHVNIVNQESKLGQSVLGKRKVPLASYVVLEGLPGSGKTEVAKYFRHISNHNKVRCFYVSALREDRSVEYGVYRKLFISLVGKENFTSVENQKQTIVTVLHLTYPDLSDSCLLRKKFPVLKEVLQLSWHLRLGAEGTFSALQSDDLSLLGRLLAEHKCRLDLYLHASTTSEVLCTLLSGIPASIVIDDAHHCDSMTWTELCRLTTQKIPLVLLLTVVPSAISLSNGFVKLKLSSALHSADTTAPTTNVCMPVQLLQQWSKRSKPHIVSALIPVMAGGSGPSLLCEPHLMPVHPNGSVLHLSPLSMTQIRAILVATLGIVEEELVQLLCGFSSGHASWVVLIVSYICQFGLSSFMDSVDKADTERLRPLDGCTKGLPTNSSSSISLSHRMDGWANPGKQLSGIGSEYDSALLRNYVVSLIDLLSPSEQIVLKHAAAIGMCFYENVLHDVIEAGIFRRGKDRSKFLLTILHTLQERYFIVPSSAAKHCYEFHNNRIREIVYDLTPPSDRWHTHLRVARSIEQRFASAISTTHMCESLAYHYHMAGLESSCGKSRAKAMHYALRSAALFLDRGSMELVLGYLEHAEGLATRSLDGCRQIVKLTRRALKMIEMNGMQSEQIRKSSNTSRVRSTIDVNQTSLKGLQDLRDRLSNLMMQCQMEDSTRVAHDRFRVYPQEEE